MSEQIISISDKDKEHSASSGWDALASSPFGAGEHQGSESGELPPEFAHLRGMNLTPDDIDALNGAIKRSEQLGIDGTESELQGYYERVLSEIRTAGSHYYGPEASGPGSIFGTLPRHTVDEAAAKLSNKYIAGRSRVPRLLRRIHDRKYSQAFEKLNIIRESGDSIATTSEFLSKERKRGLGSKALELVGLRLPGQDRLLSSVMFGLELNKQDINTGLYNLRQLMEYEDKIRERDGLRADLRSARETADHASRLDMPNRPAGYDPTIGAASILRSDEHYQLERDALQRIDRVISIMKKNLSRWSGNGCQGHIDLYEEK